MTWVSLINVRRILLSTLPADPFSAIEIIVWCSQPAVTRGLPQPQLPNPDENQASSVPLVSMDRAGASPGVGGSWRPRRETREPGNSRTPETCDHLWR